MLLTQFCRLADYFMRNPDSEFKSNPICNLELHIPHNPGKGFDLVVEATHLNVNGSPTLIFEVDGPPFASEEVSDFEGSRLRAFDSSARIPDGNFHHSVQRCRRE